MLLTTVLAALLSISFVDAAIPNAMLRGRPVIPQISVPEHLLTSPNGTVLPPLTTVYYFDQLIDHNDSSLGTFQQRYWMNWEFYTDGILRFASLRSSWMYALMNQNTCRRSYRTYDYRGDQR
jgi:hypothetical protein